MMDGTAAAAAWVLLAAAGGCAVWAWAGGGWPAAGLALCLSGLSRAAAHHR
jgi:hypothetical protein